MASVGTARDGEAAGVARTHKRPCTAMGPPSNFYRSERFEVVSMILRRTPCTMPGSSKDRPSVWSLASIRSVTCWSTSATAAPLHGRNQGYQQANLS